MLSKSTADQSWLLGHCYVGTAALPVSAAVLLLRRCSAVAALLPLLLSLVLDIASFAKTKPSI